MLEWHSFYCCSALRVFTLPPCLSFPFPVDAAKRFHDADELRALGMDRLKEALEALGLKCGGTLEQRADRLFSVKGKKPEEIDQKLKVHERMHFFFFVSSFAKVLPTFFALLSGWLVGLWVLVAGAVCGCRCLRVCDTFVSRSKEAGKIFRPLPPLS